MRRFPLCAALALAVFAASAAHGSTPVSGQITTDEVWTPAGNPYLPTGPITLQAGVTLTLEPGTVVEFAAGSFLSVQGTLLIEGTAQEPVILGPTAGNATWYGILFGSTAGAPTVDGAGNYVNGSLIEHALFLGAGEDAVATGGLTLSAGVPYLSHVRFESGGGNAVQGTLDPGQTLHVISCEFVDNEDSAIDVTGGDLHRVLDSEFTGNGLAGVRLSGGTGHRILGSRFWIPAGGFYNLAVLVESADDVVVADCDVEPLGSDPIGSRRTGVWLNEVTNGTVENSRFRRCETGVRVEGSNLLVRDNRMREGIYLVTSVQDNRVGQQIYGEAVPSGASGLQVEDNVIEGGRIGMLFQAFGDAEVRGNLVRGTDFTGCQVTTSGSILLEGNLLLDGGGEGLKVSAGVGSILRDNTVQGFEAEGLFLAGFASAAEPGLVEGNVITGNRHRGLRVGTGHARFLGNDFSGNEYPHGSDTGVEGGNLVFLGSGTTADFSGDELAGVYNRLVDDAPGGMSAYAVRNLSTSEVDLTRVCWGGSGPTILNYPGSSAITEPTVDCSILAVPGPDAVAPLPLSVHPNPARGPAVIRFTLAEPARAVLQVHDVGGREVIRLSDESLGEGVHEVRWDGRDAAGRSTSAGVYFLRLVAGDLVASRRVLRLDP